MRGKYFGKKKKEYWNHLSNQGFSLAEVLVSIVIFALVMSGVAYGITVAAKATMSSISQSKAHDLAESAASAAKAVPYDTMKNAAEKHTKLSIGTNDYEVKEISPLQYELTLVKKDSDKTDYGCKITATYENHKNASMTVNKGTAFQFSYDIGKAVSGWPSLSDQKIYFDKVDLDFSTVKDKKQAVCDAFIKRYSYEKKASGTGTITIDLDSKYFEKAATDYAASALQYEKTQAVPVYIKTDNWKEKGTYRYIDLDFSNVQQEDCIFDVYIGVTREQLRQKEQAKNITAFQIVKKTGKKNIVANVFCKNTDENNYNNKGIFIKISDTGNPVNDSDQAMENVDVDEGTEFYIKLDTCKLMGDADTYEIIMVERKDGIYDLPFEANADGTLDFQEGSTDAKAVCSDVSVEATYRDKKASIK